MKTLNFFFFFFDIQFIRKVIEHPTTTVLNEYQYSETRLNERFWIAGFLGQREDTLSYLMNVIYDYGPVPNSADDMQMTNSVRHAEIWLQNFHVYLTCTATRERGYDVWKILNLKKNPM